MNVKIIHFSQCSESRANISLSNPVPVAEDERRLPVVRVGELQRLVVELQGGVGVALRVAEVALLAQGAAQLRVLAAEPNGGRVLAQLGGSSMGFYGPKNGPIRGPRWRLNSLYVQGDTHGRGHTFAHLIIGLRKNTTDPDLV